LDISTVALDRGETLEQLAPNSTVSAQTSKRMIEVRELSGGISALAKNIKSTFDLVQSAEGEFMGIAL
jgi:hypothetical protein